MASDTFKSGGSAYNITVNGAPGAGGKKWPVIVFVHGNFGMGAPYGDQIKKFAKDVNALGYVTAVPQYYLDNEPHLADTTPHVQTVTDAIDAVLRRPDADGDRMGLVGFSLGAATAMTFIASNPAGTVKVLIDFFGFLTPAIRKEVSRFPPTLILHNDDDHVVSVENSRELDRLLPPTIDHRRIEYQEQWPPANHAFKPGDPPDVSSRSEAAKWLTRYIPPVGK
jgi:dienelactone hydrolase